MGKVLRQRLRQSRFESPIQEMVLNLLVASGHLHTRIEGVCREHGLTLAQYNVLRILRGAQPDGLPRSEITARMVDRAPDVTRLLDRLEQAGAVTRARSDSDARQSIARITRGGLQLLDRLDVHVRAGHQQLSERITSREAAQLSLLLEKLYEGDL